MQLKLFNLGLLNRVGICFITIITSFTYTLQQLMCLGMSKAKPKCFNQLFVQNIWIMQKVNFLSENHSQYRILAHGACGLNNTAVKIKCCDIKAFVDTNCTL